MASPQRLKHVLRLAIFLAGATCFAASKRTELSLSIPRLPIASGERVVGFEFHVTSGRIVRLADAPAGWNITIDNDPSWKTSVSGSIIVASAAVNGSYFRNCLIIEKSESLGQPFSMHGDVVVTRDFVKERRIPISMHDITLSPVSK